MSDLTYKDNLRRVLVWGLLLFVVFVALFLAAKIDSPPMLVESEEPVAEIRDAIELRDEVLDEWCLDNPEKCKG